jgi:hypothetical protein
MHDGQQNVDLHDPSLDDLNNSLAKPQLQNTSIFAGKQKSG